jgi:hypothetical protein
MPAADLMLLLCLALTLLGLLVTAVAYRRGNAGRALQGVGLTLAPAGLYFSGLLGLLWRGGVAVGNWVAGLSMSRTVWLGLSVLAVCLVLWVVGGIVARRSPRKSRRRSVSGTASPSPAEVGAPAGKASATSKTPAKAGAQKPAPVDDDLAEIEALLKSRGID